MTTTANYDSLVQELYIAYFGRPSDYFGLQNFDQALTAAQAPSDPTLLLAAYPLNPAVKSLVDAFGTSAESVALYSGGSTESFVNAIFTDLFNRPAALSGMQFWMNAIDSGEVSRGLAALAILVGAMQNTSAQGLIDQHAIANKVTVAENFTTAVGGLSSYIVAYHGPTAAELARLMLDAVDSTTVPASFDIQTTLDNIVGQHPGSVYILTTAPENLVGGPGNNVFIGVLDNAAGLAAGGQVQTLLSGDAITGGGVSNILYLTDFGVGGVMSLPEGVTIDGVGTWNISSLEAVSGDFSKESGLATLNVKYSVGDDVVVVGNQTTVDITDSAGNVSVQGGAAISVTTDNAHTVSLTSSAAAFKASVGDSSNSVTDITVDASVEIAAGAGANTVTLGAAASGTISFAAHTAADAVVLAPSEANIGAIVSISGLNNVGSDTIRFSGDAGTLQGFTQVTAQAVTGSGGNTANFAAWVQAADGAQGSGIGGAAHTVTWFVFQGNTYVLESLAGQTVDAGVMAAGNTLVELTGTGYTFAHATGANGTLHLLG